MKNPDKPFFTPSPAAVLRAYEASGRKHLILTGTKGIGKSTLLLQLLPLLSIKIPIPGITTKALPRQAVYLTDSITNTTSCIGRYDADLPGTENKMQPVTESFLSHGLSAIHQLKQAESPFVFLDEIGYLESSCPEYCSAITELFHNKNLICVIRKQKIPYLESLLGRDDVFLVDLDSPYGTGGCILMASGMSTRFGSNKLLTDFKGRKLIEYALSATDNVFSQRYVITRHKDIAELCQNKGTNAVLHEQPYRSDTVKLGISQLKEPLDWCMFCPSDQPLLSVETIQTLALSAANHPHRILRLSYRNTYGAPVIFPKEYFEQLQHLPQGKGGNYIIQKHPQNVVSIPAKTAWELKDVDTKEDLWELEKLPVMSRCETGEISIAESNCP